MPPAARNLFIKRFLDFQKFFIRVFAIKRIGLIVFVYLIGLSGLFAGERTPAISGRVKFFTSFFVSDNPDGTFFRHDSGDFSFKRVEARIKVAGRFNNRVSYNLRFDAFSNSGTVFTGDQFPEAGILGSPLYTEYFEINLYEGNIKVSDFLVKKLDFTVGKQRIQWGSADKVNVVDVLNPIDFANFFTFDPDYAYERRPQTALNFEYYMGMTSKLQFVWLFRHQVAPLPFGYTFLTKNFQAIDDVTVSTSWGNNIADSNFGLRFSTTILNIDTALYYFKGNSPIPSLYNLTAADKVTAEFLYPGLQMIAADISGELRGVGFWAEAAYFIPEKVTAAALLPILLNGTSQLMEQKFDLFEKGYYKYVIGADYHFGEGVYANVQYLRGFFDEADFSEKSKTFFGISTGQFFGELESYAIGRLEYSNPAGTLKIGLGGIYEITDKNSFSLTPTLEFKVADSMLIQAGGFFNLSGDPKLTKFGMFRDDRIVYVSFKLDF